MSTNLSWHVLHAGNYEDSDGMCVTGKDLESFATSAGFVMIEVRDMVPAGTRMWCRCSC